MLSRSSVRRPAVHATTTPRHQTPRHQGREDGKARLGGCRLDDALPLVATAALVLCCCLLLPMQSTSAQQVAIGISNACVLTAPLGELYCWGNTSSSSSVYIEPPSGAFSQISTSFLHSVALRDDGTTVAWGAYGAVTQSVLQPPPDVLFEQVVACDEYACGITVGGGLACWSAPGSNFPDFDPTNAPESVAAHNWTTAVCGERTLCAHSTTSQVFCWSVGHGPIDDLLEPPSDLRFVSIGIRGMLHGIQANGSVGSFDIAYIMPRDNFAALPSVASSIFVSVVGGGSQVTCGIRSDQTITCGSADSYEILTPPSFNYFSQLGTGGLNAIGVEANNGVLGFGTLPGSPDFGPSGPPSTLASISMGELSTCVRRLATSTIACFGKLGSAIQPPTGSFSQLVSSISHSCAIRSDDGTIACWGEGNGMKKPPPLGEFAYLSAGVDYSCAIRRDDSSILCWGDDSFAQSTPPSGEFVRVSCGVEHACGIHTDGTVVCWGNEDGSALDAPPGSFAEVYCGLQFSCALTTGLMQPRCWGKAAETPTISYPPANSSYSAEMFLLGLDPIGWSPQTGWFPDNPFGDDVDGATLLSIAVSMSTEKLCAIQNGTNHMLCQSDVDNAFGQFTPPGLEVGQLAPRHFYKLGRHILPCPHGTFSLSPGAITPMCSGPCAAGRYGYTSQETSSECTGACPRGTYCPVHTGQPLLCEAGRFGMSEGLSEEACSGECPFGYYCPDGTAYSSDYPCPSGRFGSERGLRNSSCSGECAAGHWCPRGSDYPTLECGAASVFCPAGSGKPKPVTRGSYGVSSIDNSTLTQTDEAPCPLGHSCDGSGGPRPCATGSYQNATGQDTCEPCGIGRYASAAGLSECAECPPGQVSTAPGLSVCVPCPPGRTNGTNPAVCDVCTAGKSSVGGSACADCPAGSYSARDGSIFCTPCAVGTSQMRNGRTSCSACLPGSFTSGFNSTECASCAAGSFATGNGSVSCTPCEQGTASSSSSLSTPCPPCAPGRYQGAVGSIKCEKCQKRFESREEGASVCTPVKCQTGQQPTDDSICEVCPLGQASTDGTQCGVCGLNLYTPHRGSICVSCTQSGMDGLSCTNGLASVRADYWAYPVMDTGLNATIFQTVQCPPHYCPGAFLQQAEINATHDANTTTSLVQCTPPRSDDGGAVLCGGCQDGFVSWSGSCVSCSSVNGGLVFLYLVLSFLLVLFLLRSGSTSSDSSPSDSAGFTVILLYFVQTAMLQVGPVRSWLGWLRVFNFGSDTFSACLGPLSPYQQMQLSVFAPLILLAELGVLAAVHRAMHSTHWAQQQTPSASSSRVSAYLQSVAARFTWSSYIGGFISILLFCYTQVATSTIQYLDCTEVGDRSVVFSRPSLDCHSSEYRAHRGSVVFVLAAYIAGFPVFVLAFLWYRRERLRRLANELTIITGQQSSLATSPSKVDSPFTALASESPEEDDTATVTSDHSVAASLRALHSSRTFISRWGPLFAMYHPGAWYWQASVLARRCLFVMVSVVAVKSPDIKCLAFALLNLAALLTQLLVAPFSSPLLNRCETVAHLFLLIVAISLIPFAPPYSTALQVVLFALIVPAALALLVLALKGRVAQIRMKLRGGIGGTAKHRAHHSPEDADAEKIAAAEAAAQYSPPALRRTADLDDRQSRLALPSARSVGLGHSNLLRRMEPAQFSAPHFSSELAEVIESNQL